MSSPTTRPGPCALPDVDRAIAKTKRLHALDFLDVRLGVAAAAYNGLMSDPKLKPHERAKCREARRAFIEATKRKEDNGNGTQAEP